MPFWCSEYVFFYLLNVCSKVLKFFFSIETEKREIHPVVEAKKKTRTKIGFIGLRLEIEEEVGAERERQATDTQVNKCQDKKELEGDT